MKPIIGIILRPDKTLGKTNIMCMNKEISDTIIKMGAIPLGIMSTQIEDYYNKNIDNTLKLTEKEKKDLDFYINLCDGFIAQGGDDFYDYDINFIKKIHKKNKPLLGICLGMQAMAYAFNGTIKNLGNLNHLKKDKYVHEVFIDKRSKLYEILKKDKILVNSRHKSYVTNTELNICSLSKDLIIEGIEDKQKKFFIGVEWHPESLDDINTQKIFSHFIEEAKKTKENF